MLRQERFSEFSHRTFCFNDEICDAWRINPVVIHVEEFEELFWASAGIIIR